MGFRNCFAFFLGAVWALAAPSFGQTGEIATANQKSYDKAGALLQQAENATDRSERAAKLAQARKLLESSLDSAELQFDQARINCRLGECLVKLAGMTPKADERRKLYLTAAGKFQAAFDKSEGIVTGPVYSLWGEALLEVGKSGPDAVLLLQAVYHFKSALQLQPDDLETRFKLVRAYALLNQQDQTLSELRICADRDQTATAVWALKEPDLSAFANNPGFEKIVGNQTAPATPQSLVQSGLNLQKQADTAAPLKAAGLYSRAIAEYEKAAALQPSYYPAHLMWAICLTRLSQFSPAERLKTTQSAQERFAVASRCPEIDWRVYYNWAALLIQNVDTLAKNPEDSLAVLNEAGGLFEKSLPLANFSGDKAQVEHDSGMCLIMLAERTPNISDRQPLYEKAISKIGFAAERSPLLLTGRSYGLWGVALLQVAKLDNDRLMMRKAAERLLSSLEIDPHNAEARYNLVCAYALMDQPDNALRHLRICLGNDPNRIYYNAAVTDPDFWALRRTPDYNNILSLHMNTNTFDKPRLSQQ